MRNEDARNQLCKMVGEVGMLLGLGEAGCGACTCGAGISYGGDVPDEIISEMWRRLTHLCWREEKKPVTVDCDDPNCPGVGVFDTEDVEWPEGWVHVERCDNCAQFPHDQAAAESISDPNDVKYLCVECRKLLAEAEAATHEHERFRVMVSEYDAERAGIWSSYDLSDNQNQFCRDARKQGHKIDFSYSGRGMMGRKCPAVRLDSVGDFHTGAGHSTDSMGKGFVIYASS